MKYEDDTHILSPTDLANHLACRHLTSLSRRVAEGELARPRDYTPRTEALFERGQRHEREYLEWLRRQGRRVEVVAEEGAEALAATMELMRSGVDVIAQGLLAHGRWRGRADVLERVAKPSGLGPWSYEVTDTKLARETKGTTILQLCTYSALLERLQDLRPERMYVVSPGQELEREEYRVDDFGAYFRRIQARLEAELDADPDEVITYPDPVDHCAVCAWWQRCEERRRGDDHLCLVAGMSNLHQTELQEWEVTTRAELAALPLPIERKPSRGSRAAYERLREQARLQLASPAEGPPPWERLPIEQAYGLARLPAPSPGDVFLDFEGDPFVGLEGQEYLFGWVTIAVDGEPEYHAVWALDRAGERVAFEDLVDELMNRWESWPDFHVYHFAPYEPAALKRLMGRYALREDEIDRLLRGRRFVDLYSVVRQGLRVGVERYSLKDLERLYGYERGLDLREASRSLLAIELALEREDPDEIISGDQERVESYNRDDCVSTMRLREWLEGVRAQAVAEGEEIPRPPEEEPEPSERLTEWQEKVRSVRDCLHDGIPDDPEERTDEEHARWILGHLLEFHHREAKVDWWEFFRLAATPIEERYDEPKAIAGLEHERRIERFGKNGRRLLPIDRYTFPSQEVDERSHQARVDEETILGEIEEIDGSAGWIEIQKRRDTKEEHPESLFMFSLVSGRVLESALLRFAEWIAANGIDAPGPYRAARDLLLRHPPRLGAADQGPLCKTGETPLAAARRLCTELDGGVLPIQGPPGSGKTYTGARMILDLVRAGKSVGITALSHKVIRNLLDKTVEAAEAEGVGALRCVQKISANSEPAAGEIPIEESKSNERVLEALRGGEAQVAAGTAWLWAREEMADSVDVLFVDEAGQLSLATTLAAAQAGRSLVLIGDPQQLEQPIQGTHPTDTGAAALEHLLGDHDTIPDHLGLFLGETYRLHPTICQFTSDLYYEGRLEARAENLRQELSAPSPFDGSGLYFVSVEHQGNQSSSDEETAVIGDLVEGWLEAGAEWVDKKGKHHPLTLQDILIVAPFNVQVSRLKRRLPDARIGTVDKFQGQQAPVVLYSMTSSSPEDAPRGMEFLFSRHRLNVATSRAQCAVVLVASPRLLEPACRTPRQMRLANGLCAFVEQARIVWQAAP